jgi:hypothetical protein
MDIHFSHKLFFSDFFSNGGMIKYAQGSILGPLLSIIYINDFSPTISFSSEPIIFAEDTSFIISKKFDDFHARSNLVLSQMSKWFPANKLTLNLDKTNIIKFIINNSPQCTLSTGYKKRVKRAVNAKFFAYKLITA